MVAQWCLTKQKTTLQKQQNDYWHLCWQLDRNGFWRLKSQAHSEVTAPDEEVKGCHQWGQSGARNTCISLPALSLFSEKMRQFHSFNNPPGSVRYWFQQSLNTWTWMWREKHTIVSFRNGTLTSRYSTVMGLFRTCVFQAPSGLLFKK